MTISDPYRTPLRWTLAVFLATTLGACGGGGRDPILGAGTAVVAPVAPAAGPGTSEVVPVTDPGIAVVIPVTTPGTPVTPVTSTVVDPVIAATVSVGVVTPSVNASGVCPDAKIDATFNVPSGTRIDPTSVNSSTFTLRSGAAAPLAASSIVLDPATGRTATFTPASPLAANTTYTVLIQGGAAGVADLAKPANRMGSSVS